MRIQREDGTEVPCELIHVGVNDKGMDCWEIPESVQFRINHDKLLIKVLPPRTSVTLGGTLPKGFR